jgi:hypothetical protein
MIGMGEVSNADRCGQPDDAEHHRRARQHHPPGHAFPACGGFSAWGGAAPRAGTATCAGFVIGVKRATAPSAVFHGAPSLAHIKYELSRPNKTGHAMVMVLSYGRAR